MSENRYMASLYAPNLYPDGRDYDASASAIDVIDAKAPIASPTFTGVPAAPTAAALTSTTQLATTAFVTVADALKANLASPTFTGTVTLPVAIAIGALTEYADDTAAGVGGLAVGRLYRTGSAIKVRVA
jgi:phage-related tail protein